jgi:hypothetical protein
MGLTPASKRDDWVSIKQAVQKLSSRLGPQGSPTFQTVTVLGGTNFSGGQAGSFVLESVSSLPTGYVGQVVYLTTDNHIYLFS